MIVVTLPYPISARFGMLTVLSRADNDRFGRTQWNVHCDCGVEKVVALFRMTSGHTKSCGCIRGRDRFRHGMKGTPTHNSWCAMKQRCFYPKSDGYADYGGRGITVCERWMTFENFRADMGERPDGMTIERNDTNGNYEPGNCRWAPMPEQNRNRRSTILIERNGVTKCVKDWCDELGLNVDRVYGRIRRGSTPSEALR
ncbi:hypothetical protein AB1286_20105 [Trinickia sp. NRRL B-1857]|uniref:hypothetical protein n=1 Tax=Trinickia sp. NRRL B-1857 TaxID=3162879 RepID=UPI003D26862A